ncbi:MAG: type IV toxin-antitoxin system AbiEi family antitoxin domain-containing protein [Stellaceae bacterium]
MGKKRAAYRVDRVSDIPPGMPWVPHTVELLKSVAWRKRSIHCSRLIDRMEIEHMAHAGKENGYLVVTYDQFVEYGISRKFIRRAIEETVERGLLVVARQGAYRGGARSCPNLYRLTYLRSKFVPLAGAPYYVEPTNDWRNFSGKTSRRKSSRMVFRWEPSKYPRGELNSGPHNPTLPQKAP